MLGGEKSQLLHRYKAKGLYEIKIFLNVGTHYLKGILFLITWKVWYTRLKPRKALSQFQNMSRFDHYSPCGRIEHNLLVTCLIFSIAQTPRHQWMTWERLTPRNLGPTKHCLQGLINRSHLRVRERFRTTGYSLDCYSPGSAPQKEAPNSLG